MTLPVALLIASYKNEDISHEIRELIGTRVSILEPLSCKCKDHMNKLHLVPPSSCCSSELSSPVSDIGSDGFCGTSFGSYSYFSDENSLEKYRTNDDSDEQNIKQFTDLVDAMEDAAERFGGSTHVSNVEEVQILYQGRDILDLGGNLCKSFTITHPPVVRFGQKTKDFPKVSSVIQTCSDCGFEEFTT